MRKSIYSLASCVLLATPMVAQESEPNLSPEQIQQATEAYIKEAYPSAQQGGENQIGRQATLSISDELIFLNGRDGDKLLQEWGNLPAPLDGLVMPADASWCITFTFDSVGYVKDDEKDEIDAADILELKKEEQAEANKQRLSKGLDTLNIVKWTVEPNYNTQTNNLEWGMLLRDGSGEETINHEVRILGRHGVMSATLLCGPEQFDALKPVLDKTLEGFSYNSGNKYAEYTKGDKIAEYGLLGLMGAGGAFVLFKFWKPIAAGLVVVGVGIKKFFARFTGGSSAGRIS